jgi:hypothetical protein
VTLASLFPIVAVMALALYVSTQYSPEDIIAAANANTGMTQAQPWYAVSLGLEIVGGFRAIVPLVLFLLLVMTVLLRERIPQPRRIFFGIVLCMLA